MNISEVKSAASADGSFFFSPETMRFFRSRIGSDTFTSANGLFVYFVTSERGPDNVRRYSVRAWRPALGNVETVGTFQQFSSSRTAAAFARSLAGSRWQPINPTPAPDTAPRCAATLGSGEACWRRATHANLSGEPFAPESYRCAEHVVEAVSR